jgi:hypothetical protein
MPLCFPPIRRAPHLVSLAVSYGLAIAVLHFSQFVDGEIDMTIGWGCAVFFHVAGLMAFHRAIGLSTSKFLALATGGIFIRLFVLIIFFVIVLVGGFLQAGPFIIGVLTAYFVGSWMEIAWLVSMNRTVQPPKDTGFEGNGSGNIGSGGSISG